MDKQIDLKNIWKPFFFIDNEIRLLSFGDTQLWIKKNQNVWTIGTKNNRKKYVEQFELKHEKKWPDEIPAIQYIHSGDYFLLKPYLPDRPLVIYPDTQMIIAPEQTVVIFIQIPIFLGINAGNGTDFTLLFEKPVQNLSNTWFGSDTRDGELCYHFNCNLSYTLADIHKSALMAICPVQIKNSSSQSLIFQRLCLRVIYLNLYTGDHSMWTNDVSVNYKNVDPSHISFSSSPPDYDSNIIPLNEPRIKAEIDLIKRSFSFFKSISHY